MTNDKITWTLEEDEILKNLWESEINSKEFVIGDKTFRQMSDRAKILKFKRNLEAKRLATINTNKTILGRDLSFENCKEIASKFKSKSQFCREDNSAYVTSRNKGWLEELCSHMLVGKSFNYPQTFLFELIKQIYSECTVTYNDRKIIYPKEIDVYVSELKIGFEYDGNTFHSNEEGKINDKIKDEICINSGITLFRIKEHNKTNPTDSIVLALKDLRLDVTDIKIENALRKTQEKYLDKNDLVKIAEKYSYVEDFIKENRKLYSQLAKSKSLYLIEFLPRKRKTFTDEEILSTLDRVNSKLDFYKNHFGMYLQMMKRKPQSCVSKYKSL